MLYCWDFKDFNCCGSCHSEWDLDLGQTMQWDKEFFGISDHYPERFETVAEGCCNFGDWLIKHEVALPERLEQGMEEK